MSNRVDPILLFYLLSKIHKRIHGPIEKNRIQIQFFTAEFIKQTDPVILDVRASCRRAGVIP
jgi:hypothetical protein